MPAPVLALDTGSRVVSVALATADRVIAERHGAQRESSARLLHWIDEVLREGGVGLRELAGVAALRGPGSFTGLRIGLATVLGFHQALGLPATAVPTLEVLAAAAPPGRRLLALVSAASAEWFAQTFISGWPPQPSGEPQRLGVEALASTAGDLVVAAAAEDLPPPGVPTPPTLVAGSLAGVAARLIAGHPRRWDAALLSAPLYLAPAPASIPGTPKRVRPNEADAASGRARSDRRRPRDPS